MQQVTVREQIEYASLGWRFTAVLVDTAVLVGIWVVAAHGGHGGAHGPEQHRPQGCRGGPAARPGDLPEDHRQQLGNSSVLFYVILFGVALHLLPGARGDLQGQHRQARVRHAGHDGGRLAGRPAPPSSCATSSACRRRCSSTSLPACRAGPSPHRQRLGDYAAHTVVVRRRTAGRRHVAGLPARGGRPPSRRRSLRRSTERRRLRPLRHPRRCRPWPGAGSHGASGHRADRRTRSLRLKTAALAARGAHLNYLHFSERELAAGADGPERSYSEEYVSAWFTLTDAVAELAHGARGRGRGRARPPDRRWTRRAPHNRTSRTCCASWRPTSPPRGDEGIHEAFLAVARSDAPQS